MTKTVAFQKKARNIFFHLLTRCNLKCSHCYIDPLQHGKKMLPSETITRWLQELIHEKEPSNLILIGGEPTLHPDLSHVVRYAGKAGYASITVDTNGFFFNHILDKITPEEVDYFSVGLDGSCQDVNDLIRGKGVFKRCVAGIEKALSKGFGVSLIYTVSRLNISDLKNMPALLKTLGIDRFFIQVIGIRGRSVQAKGQKLQLTKKQWTTVVPSVAARAAELGINVTYPKVFLDKSQRFECAALVAQNYFVFPNGRVYQCPLCEDSPLHSYMFEKNELAPTPPINERDLFQLSIPEGCVMNRLIQPDNLSYDKQGKPRYRIACCLLKEELKGRR